MLYIYILIYIYIHTLFLKLSSIIVYLKRLDSSLLYKIRSRCLSIVNVIICSLFTYSFLQNFNRIFLCYKPRIPFFNSFCYLLLLRTSYCNIGSSSLFFFLGPHLWHMKVPRLGVESELQLPAYTTDTARQVPSSIFNLHHSSQQCWIPDTLSEARNWTCILMDTEWICFCCVTKGTPRIF